MKAPDTGGDTRQIIVALIGALALILVALIPVFVTMAKREASQTSPSPPTPVGPGPDEVARLWAVIEKVQADVQRSLREHAGYDALLDECQRDGTEVRTDVAKLRDELHRHAYDGHAERSQRGHGRA